MSFPKLSWMRVLILLMFCLTSSALGAFLVTTLFLNNLGNTKLIQEKTIEKNVYIENSAKISTIEKADKSIVNLFTEAEYQKYSQAKSDDVEKCTINAESCLRNGLILTSDGLVVSRVEYFQDQDLSGALIAVDNDKETYDFELLGKEGDLLLGKLLLRGDLKLNKNQRTEKLNFVAVDIANLEQLKPGQELLGIKENQYFGFSGISNCLITNVLNWKGSLAGIEVNSNNSLENISFGSNCNENYAYFNLDGQLLGLSQKDRSFLPANEVFNLLLRYEKQAKDLKKLEWKLSFYYLNQMIKSTERLPIDYGVKIFKLEKGGVATEIGLKDNDLIIAINGKSLLTDDFLDQINSLVVGESVKFSVFRDGKKFDLQVTI